MHFQQGTRTFADADQCNNAIVTVWENGGFVRRDDDTRLTVIASSDSFQQVSEALDALKNAPVEVQEEFSEGTSTTIAPPVSG